MLDKYVLGLAVGAFGLNLTFREYLGGAEPRHRWPLVLAWVWFAAAILTTLLSFAASERGLHRAAEERAHPQPHGPAWRAAARRLVESRKQTIWLNRGSLTLFMLALSAYASSLCST